MEVIQVDTRTAIEALVVEFSYRVDHGEAASVPDLFIEDGAFESPMVSLKGRAALTAAMAERAQGEHNTRHVISNLRLQPRASDVIHGTVIVTLYRWTPTDTDPAPLPVALVEYEDVYQKNEEGEWQFASRKALPVLPLTL